MHVKQVELQKTLEISREIQCYWTKNLESKLTFFPMDYFKKSLKKKYENFIKGKFDFRESPLG